MQILIGWLGFSDSKGFEKQTYDLENCGPICAALQWKKRGGKRFDRAYILHNDAFSEISNRYEEWLRGIAPDTDINMRSENVSDPTDYSDIYRKASRAVEDVMENNKASDLTFHTSSGTPQMGMIWIVLNEKFHATLLKSSKYGIKEFKSPFQLSSALIGQMEGSVLPITNFEAKTDIVNKKIIYTPGGKIATLIQGISKVAKVGRPVLLEGASGVGKEHLARIFHDSSSTTRKGNFIALNCAALPENIADAELFGHKKGAFTGADRDKTGKIELAHNGTLFLDEIGEMPVNVQVKLLRVLETRTIMKLGEDSGKCTPVNFRLVAATNRDLNQEVGNGTFRKDLYHRISAFKFRIPPLQERERGDIHELAVFFLNKLNRECERAIDNYRPKVLTENALNALCNYHWPGNVRELKSVIERAAILFREEFGSIRASDIHHVIGEESTPLYDDEQQSVDPHPSSPTNHSQDAIGHGDSEQFLHRLDQQNKVNLKEIIDEVKIHYIETALAQCAGNISKASKMLGYGNRMVYTLNKLGIDANKFRPGEYRR